MYNCKFYHYEASTQVRLYSQMCIRDRYRGAPSLNYELVRELGQEECPLVIHGGTGLAEDTFRRLVQLGAAKINISTALKLAYRDSIQNMAVKTHFTPLEADQAFGDAIRQVVVRNIQIFAGEERTVT